jgi:hypothetical protein
MDRDRCAGDPGMGELPVGELGRQAAETIRTLNHRTQPATGALSDPADAAELAQALASLTGRLPQLLGQLSRWVADEQRRGALRVDALSPCPDADAATDAVTHCLRQAAQHVNRAGRDLDAAHQQLAHLALRPDTEPHRDHERSLDP